MHFMVVLAVTFLGMLSNTYADSSLNCKIFFDTNYNESTTQLEKTLDQYLLGKVIKLGYKAVKNEKDSNFVLQNYSRSAPHFCDFDSSECIKTEYSILLTDKKTEKKHRIDGTYEHYLSGSEHYSWGGIYIGPWNNSTEVVSPKDLELDHFKKSIEDLVSQVSSCH